MEPDLPPPATSVPSSAPSWPSTAPSGRYARVTSRHHAETHAGHRANWLRAGVLGANDGLLSTASLLIGVSAASVGRSAILATGVAAIVAGAGSMAIGEFSSVSSQRDAELADLATEADELRTTPRAELSELAGIYQRRGLEPDLARQVAEALTEHDALATHARDELGIDPDALARPLQASVVSAVSFAIGAFIPLLMVLVTGASIRVGALLVSTSVGLAALGAVGARLGGAPPLRPALRVLLGGAAAMGLAWGVGLAFDVKVG